MFTPASAVVRETMEPPCAAIIRQALAAVHDEQDCLSPYRRTWALRVLAETVERSNILTVDPGLVVP